MEPAAQSATTAKRKQIEPKSGRVARQVAGVNTIEVKMILADAQIDPFLRNHKLSVDNDEKQYIHFFDIAQLT